MKKFLNELEKESKKYLNNEEVKEVVSYYEEIINERLADNEKLENILDDYNVKVIVKNMIPEMITKRDFKSHKNIFKSFWQLLLIMLFTAPILIPLAIVYLALMIAFAAITLSGVAVMISGIIAVIPYFIEIINFSTKIEVVLGLGGIGLIGSAIILLVGYLFAKVSYTIIKQMIKGFSSLILRKQVKR